MLDKDGVARSHRARRTGPHVTAAAVGTEMLKTQSCLLEPAGLRKAHEEGKVIAGWAHRGGFVGFGEL